MNKRLESIGFYTLSDARAFNVSVNSPLYRCELILTDRCNFKCPYCRGLRDDISGDIRFEDAVMVLEKWISNGLKNVRFSGGEPTLYRGLIELVTLAKKNNVDRIAISTNGYNDIGLYYRLIKAGVNDISISLDACCSSVGDAMAGGVKGAWERVVRNIKILSKITYVTVGMVFTEDNISDSLESIKFAKKLGVSDIRIIPSAQYDADLIVVNNLDIEEFNGLPILQYRMRNIKNGRHVRGIRDTDSRNCWLTIDDMAVAGDFHFPCIIHMREKGNPIGRMSDTIEKIRSDRYLWAKTHDCYQDDICRRNCLDVCVDHNNKVSLFMKQKGAL